MQSCGSDKSCNRDPRHFHTRLYRVTLQKHPSREHRIPAVLPGAYPRLEVHLEETFRHLRRRRATGVSGLCSEHLIALTARFTDHRAGLVMPRYDAFASAFASAELPAWLYYLRSVELYQCV